MVLYHTHFQRQQQCRKILQFLRNGVRQKTKQQTIQSNGSQITFTTALASSDACFIIFLNGILLDQNTPGANSIQPSMMTSFNGVYENLQTITATTTVAIKPITHS